MTKKIIGSLAILAMSVSLNATVYATVDGEEITDKEIMSLMRAVPGAKFPQLQKEQQSRVINQAIERKLLAKEAFKSGIAKNAEYKKTLNAIKSDIALEIWMKKIFAEVKISDKDTKTYFKNNQARFVKPEQVKARHILVKTKKDAQAIVEELKGLKVKSLIAKFIELAKTKSTGPSGANGGDLGWFSKKQMVPEFSQAAFGQKKGEITKTPIKTQFGYHVILTEDKRGGEKVKFEDAKKEIVNMLKMGKFRSKVSKIASNLRKKAKIVIK